MSGHEGPQPPPPPPPLPSSSAPSLVNLKSPAKLQGHVTTPLKPFEDQLTEACRGLIDNDEDQGQLGVFGLGAFVKHTNGLLQDGPQCGLVALTMAAEILGHQLSTTSLLKAAKSRKYSNHGEMFSVENMAALANSGLEKAASIRATVQPSSILCSKDELLNFMANGVILVPYDIGKDQRPALSKGHQAHWCLIIGVVVKLSSRLTVDERIQVMEKCDLSRLKDASTYQVIALLARQSKSRRLFAYHPQVTLESNLNLLEFGRGDKDAKDFILPPNGLSEGLQGKVVVLSAIELSENNV